MIHSFAGIDVIFGDDERKGHKNKHGGVHVWFPEVKEENKETDKHTPVKDQTRNNYILKLTLQRGMCTSLI